MIVIVCDHKSKAIEKAIEKGERSPIDAPTKIIFLIDRTPDGAWLVNDGGRWEPTDSSTLGSALIVDRDIICTVDGCKIKATISRSDGLPRLADFLEVQGLENVHLKNVSALLRASVLE